MNTYINNIKKSFADVANEIAKDDRKVSVGLIYTIGACVTVAAITVPVALAATKALGAVSRIGCAAVEACLKKPTESKSAPVPNVEPECWGIGEELNNANEETNNSAGDGNPQSDDTITECLKKLNTGYSTPWDAPLE